MLRQALETSSGVKDQALMLVCPLKMKELFLKNMMTTDLHVIQSSNNELDVINVSKIRSKTHKYIVVQPQFTTNKMIYSKKYSKYGVVLRNCLNKKLTTKYACHRPTVLKQYILCVEKLMNETQNVLYMYFLNSTKTQPAK